MIEPNTVPQPAFWPIPIRNPPKTPFFPDVRDKANKKIRKVDKRYIELHLEEPRWRRFRLIVFGIVRLAIERGGSGSRVTFQFVDAPDIPFKVQS